MPAKFAQFKFSNILQQNKNSVIKEKVHLNHSNWAFFKLIDLFNINVHWLVGDSSNK